MLPFKFPLRKNYPHKLFIEKYIAFPLLVLVFSHVFSSASDITIAVVSPPALTLVI